MAIERKDIAGLQYVIFPASQLGLFARPVSGGFMPIGPMEVLALSGGEAALNGPMFDVCSGQDLPAGNAAHYAASVCDKLAYKHYDPRAGLNAAGTSLFAGMTFSVTPRGVSVLPGSEFPPDAKVSVQTFPILLQDGVNRASTSEVNNHPEWRSALALMPDGRLAFVAGIGTLHGFADAIAQAGVKYAGYTDGGGSTAMVTPNGKIGGQGEHRRVPSWLIVRPAESRKGVWVVLGLVVASVTAWWWGEK